MPRQIVRNFGKCLSFDGSTARVVTNLWSTKTTGFTILGFFKTNDFKAQNQTIFSNGDGLVGGYSFGINGNGKADGTLFNLNHTIAWNQINKKIVDRGWHIFIFTINASGNHFEVLDGVQIDSGTIPNLTTPTNFSYVGDDNTGRWFKGKIDEVRYYNRLFTLAEAQAFCYGVEPNPSGLVSRYKFDEGSGTTAIDSAGAKNGTITAASYSSDVFMIPRNIVT